MNIQPPSSENERLQKLEDYHLRGFKPEKELQELAKLASLICSTPISLITIVDKDIQFFLAQTGIDGNETLRKDSFCQHSLDDPDQVLVVPDATKDIRFSENPYVLGEPDIRFYAGAPLVTPDKKVLGTLCVIDKKPRRINEEQREALKILAKRAMDFLTARKVIADQEERLIVSSEKLKKITNEVPGVIYMLERSLEGTLSFSFVSQGISRFNSKLSPESVAKDPQLPFSFIHPDDVPQVFKSIEKSYSSMSTWFMELRIITDDGSVKWISGKALPEIRKDGSVVWYGNAINITNRKLYEETMEQIAFDISHVLRRPVSTLLGLTSIIDKDEIDQKELKTYSGHIRKVADEMDKFTRRLNDTYQNKWKMISTASKDADLNK